MLRFFRSLTLIILLIILITALYFNLNQYLTFDTLKQHREAITLWTKENYYLAVIIFILTYTLSVAISLPGATFFTLVAGFLFGLIWGTLYAVMSATLGATILFLAIKNALAPKWAKKADKWLDKIRQGFKKNSIEYLLILRLIPLFPFWAVNIFLALLDLKTSLFVITTFFGILPAAFIYVSVGNGLGFIFAQNQAPNTNIIFEPPILLALTALCLLILLPRFYKKFKKK